MNIEYEIADVLIIGAGMAGLAAASVLENNGMQVMVVDKGRNVGGRMSSRQIGPGLADHGAQFFTVRDPAFEAIVNDWLEQGVVFVWSHGFSDGSLETAPKEGNARYAARGGMGQLARHIAGNLRDVRLRTPIATATCDDKGWILQDEDGQLYMGTALLLTAPVPQSLQILDEGATVLARDDYLTLSGIEYAPCLTGIFLIDGAVTLPYPGAIQRKDAHTAWISDNHEKGISPDAVTITVQASEDYSVQMWSAPDARVLSALRTDMEIYLRDGATVREAQLKRWRYSRPVNPLDVQVFVADNDPPLLFAGDAFGGPRVEGAVLSGIAAAERLIAMSS